MAKSKGNSNGEKQPKEETFYSTSEEVEKIAKALIPEYHPELAEANIAYLFVSKTIKSAGKEIGGKASKVSGPNQFLAGGVDFYLLISFPTWNSPDMSNNRKVALVDHLLERCTGEEDEDNGKMKWKTRSPDVMEFSSILERRGAWTPELSDMVDVASQLSLDARAQEVLDSSES